ncbi:hypothetical protein AGMMS50293_10770 [Spirochaetia bacterium]|nr:hypothetical protein AGMMS50293_10770 [Spirochaetia bacterium]
MSFLLLVFFSCTSKNPVIDSIYPKIGRMGETITIRGKNFGKERDESYVTIAGTSPTNSSYLNWQDDLIAVRAPEFGESGLVYVYVKDRKSNSALFSNLAHLPRPAEGDNTGLEPRIISVQPQSAATGSLVTITGNNFGNSREGGGVFFTWNSETHSSTPAEAKAHEFIEVADAEFGYEFWNEREIRLRLPDGAVSGNLEIRTGRGNSRPFFFDVTGKPGIKTFKDKRSYTFSYSVDVKVSAAERPNTLYLWVPQPAVSPSQRNLSLVSRNIEPFVENYRGTSLFKLDDMAPNSNAQINLSFNVEVYAQETNLRPQSIRQEDTPPLAGVYTQGSFLVPADDQDIKTQAAAILGRERNPYIKAQQIYEWFIREMSVQAEILPAGSAIAALNSKQADSYTAALLYCALVRAAGVPCVPVAGVLVNRNRQVMRHYWAEFWIDGFGWVPVDPAMGAGAVPPSYIIRQDRASYYFGNMDSQRIAFSRGEINLSQMDPRGRPVTHTHSYSLQNLWEEAAGGLESYSSLWGDITITGIYVQ